MEILVQKFGGSSLSSVAKVISCAKKTLSALKGSRCVVVVSAMGSLTDVLRGHLNNLRCQIPRESDVVLSAGEQISAGLFASALCSLGKPAISLMNWQIPILTDENHGSAKIISIKKEVILQHLKESKVVVVPGFQGISPSGEVTTLKKGGSDTTAVFLACALGAKSCQIYTDVDGVFAFDPRKIGSCKPFDKMGYQQIRELCLGEDLLQEDAIEIARANNLPVHILPSQSNGAGTRISSELEENFGFAVSSHVKKIMLESKHPEPILDFAKVGSLKLDCLSIEAGRAIAILSDPGAMLIPAGLGVMRNIAIVNIVGSSQLAEPINIARILHALDGIEIKFFKSSAIKITIAITEAQEKKAIANLHHLYRTQHPEEIQDLAEAF